MTTDFTFEGGPLTGVVRLPDNTRFFAWNAAGINEEDPYGPDQRTMLVRNRYVRDGSVLRWVPSQGVGAPKSLVEILDHRKPW